MYSFVALNQDSPAMSLMKSVSGIRGTIGGKPGDNFTPADIVAFTTSYGQWLRKKYKSPVVAIGRDGRPSGEMVLALVTGTLQSLGIDVHSLNYSTTPTVEMYVKNKGLSGGIIITASHNPVEWNALKFLNNNGEFIAEKDGKAIIEMAASGVSDISFAHVNRLGKVLHIDGSNAIRDHVKAILKHPLIKARKIQQAGLKVVVDCINSTGSLAVPALLDALGVKYKLINPDFQSGNGFAHNPEPLPGHLRELQDAVKKWKGALGVAVDPDVDRLALVMEDGGFFGEEYTLVCAADYVLRHRKGSVVSNLSSSRALADIARTHGVKYYNSKVGEVHVVSEMKKRRAVLGGEGNGGVIDPELHYGRDALMGLALVLMNMADTGKKLMELKSDYPAYEMVKDKIVIQGVPDLEERLSRISTHFAAFPKDTRDGLKIDLPDSWVQLRKSNTEPIIRIYAEARSTRSARDLINRVRNILEA